MRYMMSMGKHTPDSEMTKDSSSLTLKQQTSCSECKKLTTDLKKCSRCMSVAYCNKECQLKDWPNHKKLCSSGKLKAEKGSATVKEISDESGCSRKTKKTMADDKIKAEDRSAFEFLSKCWVPSISTEHKTYYAFGNTRMQDFIRDFKVSRDMEDILVMGLGDVRHVMATVAGLSRDPFSAVTSKGVRFHLNDVDQDVIARDVIILEIMNKVDPESKSDAEFLWSVWYNAFMVEKDFIRLKDLLGDLIDKYSNSSRDSERICKFGDKESFKSVLKTWNGWLNMRLDQPSVKQSRLRFFEDAGCTLSFSESNIAKYGSMQLYFDRGIKESEVEIVGQEMLTVDINGFFNFSEDRIKGRKDFVNPTLMRPGCEEWRVEYSANAAGCYLPLPR